MEPLVQILLLLAAAVTMVLIFQRLHLPSTLGYLLVGVVLGPYTIGPVVDGGQIRAVAEFGIVFLLFTIGLSYSLPQLRAMRSSLFGLGLGQVLLTTAVIGLAAWLLGLPGPAAFVLGAVFAQSSTTIITKQLLDQGEDQSRHGRLGTALSVFQDVTAVPFLVVIPVLGFPAVDDLAASLAIDLSRALAAAVLAFLVLFVLARWLLRPLFHLIAARRSGELFTLTVLLVSLCAAWLTRSLGLSMAIGAFLAGMLLGETEFRHQVEATIRPFRDVLLGAFFVSIGMLFDPGLLPAIWGAAITGALSLLLVKALLVLLLARISGIDPLTAWRTALVLAVGGEFGFALLAIGLEAEVIGQELVQIAFLSVLLSMIAAPFLIRYNHVISGWFVRSPPLHPGAADSSDLRADAGSMGSLHNHVIICGYGRIGQSVGHSLEREQIRYIALDLDPARVREARVAGEPVYYGDAADPAILDAAGLGQARLVLVSHGDLAASHRVLRHVRSLHADLPVMIRTRDEVPAEELRRAGATEVVPETLEASLMIASHVLLLLDVPLSHVVARMQRQWGNRYRLLRELFRGDSLVVREQADISADRLIPVQLPEKCRAIGRTIAEAVPGQVVVTALTRHNQRQLNPATDTRLQAGDVLVLFGSPDDLQKAERRLLGR